MNSPYMGRFQISQAYKGAAHDGLDLVGIDSKEIHATATGEVVFSGWENPSNHSQGFGQYVVILADGLCYHYGHLSEIMVSVGQQVRCTDVIGIEGYTGHVIPSGPGGSHCHYATTAFAHQCHRELLLMSVRSQASLTMRAASTMTAIVLRLRLRQQLLCPIYALCSLHSIPRAVCLM